jgi:hypothetical protein
MDPAATVQTFTAEEQPTPEGYIAPFPVADMAMPDALRLKQFYGEPEKAGLNLEAFRAAQPAAGSAETAAVSPSGDGKLYIGNREVYLDEEGGAYKDVDTDEVVQVYARGGTVQAPIGLRNGGQPKSKGYDYANAARTFGQGLTFGFGDEIEAKLRTLAARDPNAYRNEVNRIRMLQERYGEANPKTAMALEAAGMIGGSLAAPSLGGARALASAPRAARFLAGAADDLGQGALYAAGQAKTMRDVPRTIREEAPINAAFYGGMSGAGAAGRRLANTKAGLAVRKAAAKPLAALRR